MAGSRTLKLSILADVDDLKKKLNEGSNEVEGFGAKLEGFGKAAAAAFAVAAAAAAAYASKLAIEGVKAALEDEQAQLRLSSALKAATGATDAQIASTEDYITKMQLATGVSDNDLRESMQRLSVSTKDVQKSQALLNLALDVSKGSGKDLASVTEALAKAYEGQDTKLARLGIGLSAADLKAMNFTQTTQALADLYGGAAARNAETFQGKIDRLKQGFDEAKESLGYALLPYVEKFISYLNTKGIPILNAFIAGLTGNDGLKAALDDSQKGAESFGNAIRITAGIIGGFITFVKETIGLVVELANQAIKFINLVKPGKDIAYIANPMTSLPSGQGYIGNPYPSSGSTTNAVTSATNAAIASLPSYSTAGVATAQQSGGQAATSLQSQTTSGMTAAQIVAAATAPVANTYNLYVSGAIDPEGTARAISSVLGDSSTRGGTGINYLGIPGLAF